MKLYGKGKILTEKNSPKMDKTCDRMCLFCYFVPCCKGSFWQQNGFYEAIHDCNAGVLHSTSDVISAMMS